MAISQLAPASNLTLLMDKSDRALLASYLESGFRNQCAGQLVRIHERFKPSPPGYLGKVAGSQLLLTFQAQSCSFARILELECQELRSE